MKTIDNLEGEIWKPVVGYEGLYEVSSMGRVKSLKYGRYEQVKIMKQQYTTQGYCTVSLRGKGQRVHRLVGFAFIPNPENKETINHKNGIKDDNRVENLEWMTLTENFEHAKATGLIGGNRKSSFGKPYKKIKDFIQSDKNNNLSISIPKNNFVIEMYDFNTYKLIKSFQSMDEVKKWFYDKGLRKQFFQNNIIKARIILLRLRFCMWI